MPIPDIDRDTLLKEIEEDDQAELVSVSEDEIQVFDLEYGKDISFHLSGYEPQELARRIHFGSSLLEPGADEWPLKAAETLCKLPPELFVTLQHVFVVGNNSDVEKLCDELGLDFDMAPEQLFDEDSETGLADDILGQNWFQESSVFVNMDAIRKCVVENWADIPDRIPREMEIGFWSTLFHELRHQQVDGYPYEVEWQKDGDEKEDAVESWAREQTELLIGIF